ncbi:leucine-rich repeat domain-containing protein [Pandoraea sputorum]|uniref:hypothetical protein n=1 Tax=Pandoraea sputorum TaxID=93222 RepID=UPI00123F5FCA|nr:hypothetical protein [Pandoraea sputorum]VVE58463.1 hypothetical protein PSP20601_05324 [Pandoraea sputorum]
MKVTPAMQFPVDQLYNLEIEAKKKTEVVQTSRKNFFKSELNRDEFTPTKKLAEQGALPGKTGPWEKVSLDFSRFSLTDEQLCELAEFIESQPVLLRDLYLNLSECSGQESQLGLETMFKSLENAKGLQILTINLSSSRYAENDETLSILGKSVVDLPALKGFSLDISGNNFSDKSVAGLFYDLPKAKTLKEVSFDFSGSKQISIKTFEEISNSVAQSESLKKISLDFSNINKIDDESTVYFGWVLGGMASEPEEFNLNIGGTQCTKSGIENIAQSSKSSGIKKLNIYAMDAPHINDDAHHIIKELRAYGMDATLYTRPKDFGFA